MIDIFSVGSQSSSSSACLLYFCWFCLRWFVALLLLLFKWWLGYQHDRSVCMGLLGGAKPWLCRIESSPTKMPCVYACVKNIRKVSRTVWMHFERGMVPVDIRQKFTLHSRKKNDPTSRSLTLSFSLSGWLLLSKTKKAALLLCQRHNRTLWTNFSAENVLFSDLPLFYERLGSVGQNRAKQRCPSACVFMWLTGEMSVYIKSI